MNYSANHFRGIWRLWAGFVAGIGGSLILPLMVDTVFGSAGSSEFHALLVNLSFLIPPALGAFGSPRWAWARGMLAGTTGLCALLLLPASIAFSAPWSPVWVAGLLVGLGCCLACWAVLRQARWADMTAFVLVVLSLLIVTNLRRQ